MAKVVVTNTQGFEDRLREGRRNASKAPTNPADVELAAVGTVGVTVGTVAEGRDTEVPHAHEPACEVCFGHPPLLFNVLNLLYLSLPVGFLIDFGSLLGGR